MSAYYNEIDPFKAAVLREAINAGAIAPGDVDERSIVDVRPGDIAGYTQCHFFAGGGFWSLALRQAGWPDERPVWTASTPCPSFSAAGKGLGFSDPRHLWPEVERLARIHRPAILFGEQVASAIGHGWLDLVQADLEALDYAVGKAVLGACSVGAPHIRQRLYFVADAEERGSGALDGKPRPCVGRESKARGLGARGFLGDPAQRGLGIDGGAPGRAGHADSADLARRMANANGPEPGDGGIQRSGELGQQPQDSGSGSVADTSDGGLQTGRLDGKRSQGSCGLGNSATIDEPAAPELRADVGPGPLNGFWRDADWIGCRDGRWRPVESGTFPLANGASCRVGRLRGYGDAIVSPTAQAFIESYLEVEKDLI